MIKVFADTIEIVDNGVFTLLFSLRYNPTPDIYLSVICQVCSQNGDLSNIGGWVIHYHPDFIKMDFDLNACIEDAKAHIVDFPHNRYDWHEIQPGTFNLKRK